MSWNVQELDDNTLRLLCVDGIGGSTIATLEAGAGGLLEVGDSVISGDAQNWLPKGACDLLRNRMRNVNVDAARRSAIAIDANLIVITDDEFPKLLMPLPACPASLWYQGNLEVLDTPAVAIVGSRRCSAYGIEQTKIFTKYIVASELVVLSGGARGIDAAAHRATLTYGGSTCAILGSGLQQLYPKDHVLLFNQIVENGGLLLSEFPCQTTPKPTNFPRRNRIISGLSSVVLVIEAAKRSGALLTARISVEEHGKQVFVVPGRLNDPTSAGCLKAIEERWVDVAIDPQIVVNESIASWNRFKANEGQGSYS